MADDTFLLSNTDLRRLSLIDFSSADDSLIATSPQHSGPSFEDAAIKLREWEQEPQPNETQSPEKTSKCNLRASLAWDKAFFTSAGVLDPEELSSMIEKKGEKLALALPGIQEDVQGSCESFSTFESDSLTLESLEADLFGDVRASIQKSSSRVSNEASVNSKARVPSPRFRTDRFSKRDGMASCNKIPSSKSPSAVMQGAGKLTKKSPIFSQLPGTPVASREEPSILKQSKLLGKSTPSSTISSKRASPSNLHVKSENDKAKGLIGGKVNSMTSTPVFKGSQVIVPKPTISSKSPSGLSGATKTKPRISTSSGSNLSGSIGKSLSNSLSGNIGKSPSNSLKRKVDAGTKKLSPSSVARTPLRNASRDKIGSSNSSLSGLMSVTKLSSSISPASSISNWSSESSSSTSMVKYRSNRLRTSFDSSSSRKDLSDIDAQQCSNSQNPESASSVERKKTQPIFQSVRTAASGMVTSPSPPQKPSRIRLPSPKIGFFDGARTPRRRMQPPTAVSHSLPGHGTGSFSPSPSEGQNKTKLRKLQPSVTSIDNKKFNDQHTSNPVPLHESLDVAIKSPTALKHDKSSCVATMEVQNETHLKAGVVNLDSNDTMAGGNLIHDLNLGSTQENSHCDDQVDCLSRQVGLLDIN
ncbi:uncharacterized protein LOC130721372 [Lotus japonicus]|uniref:uncharacterized protein LOC130721372 n=1 Tax=Lotus japonicus TaxID=34305 RepID=UPI00258A035D|nr:uncharacterized protein LOC130721372 [Lotus japonicus]